MKKFNFSFLTMIVPYKFKYEKVCGKCKDWGKPILEYVGGKEKIGEHFHYSTVGIQILSNILAKATGKNMKEFCTESRLEDI